MIIYKIFPEQSLICVRYIGVCTPNDSIAFINQIREEPSYSEEYDLISDSSLLTLAFDQIGLQKIKAVVRQHVPGRRKPKLVVIAPALVHFGMSRMFCILTESIAPWEMFVFRDMASGIECIGRAGETITAYFQEAVEVGQCKTD